MIPKLARPIVRGAPWATLSNLQVECEFNDVRSVCAAYLFLLEQGAAGEIYNGCSGTMHSLQEIPLGLRAHHRPHHRRACRPRSHSPERGLNQLCGDPRKLKDLMASVGQPWNLPALQETLESVLAGLPAK